MCIYTYDAYFFSNTNFLRNLSSVTQFNTIKEENLRFTFIISTNKFLMQKFMDIYFFSNTNYLKKKNLSSAIQFNTIEAENL